MCWHKRIPSIINDFKEKKHNSVSRSLLSYFVSLLSFLLILFYASFLCLYTKRFNELLFKIKCHTWQCNYIFVNNHCELSLDIDFVSTHNTAMLQKVFLFLAVFKASLPCDGDWRKSLWFAKNMIACFKYHKIITFTLQNP